MSHNAVTGHDSSFSITSNVIGILNFRLDLITSYIAFVNLARESDEELDEFMEDVQITSDQIAALRKILPYVTDEDFTNRVRGLKRLVKEVETLLSALLNDSRDKGKRLEGAWHPANEAGRKEHPLDFRFRRKVVWLFRRR